jgi:hypothetical protein
MAEEISNKKECKNTVLMDIIIIPMPLYTTLL